ncbi:MAG: alpha-glucosidase [Anaerolineales bacterium]|nr:alpha-glucosidase [Anaerolineales bacterium]
MKKAWWKESIVYQVYPRSFYDSNGDGIGDLRGVIQKLDYLKTLGVDVVWLSPVYKSPNDDNGYDISDYQDIMDDFGAMADWEELLDEMHQRGIKLIMDLVVNHTSDEHPWFVEARKSRDNSYRDFYYWRPGKDGAEPNNWLSFFGGSAWEYDSATDEYYLHMFTKKQPDLNWENPRVRRAVYDMMHWWLKKGIDGFRMDVITLISKTPGLPDAPVTSTEMPYQFPGDLVFHGPRLMEFLREMKQEVLSKYDMLTVGEAATATPEIGIEITHEETGVLNMLFQFEHVELDSAEPHGVGKWQHKPLDLLEMKRVMTNWQKALEGKGWNSLYFSNHDQPRQVSRFGDDGEYRVESAKMLATFLHMQPGTPYIYQGEEIGMTNVKFESIEDYRDIETHNMYRIAVNEMGFDPRFVMEMIYSKGRDNARTPFQWDDMENAGFTHGLPWIKVNPNYKEINAANALADPDSIFYYYQRLIRLRKQHPIIVYGTYTLILDDHPQIYAFTRSMKGERLLVVLNFSGDTPAFSLPAPLALENQELLISNYPVDAEKDICQITLRPYEARVYRLW